MPECKHAAAGLVKRVLRRGPYMTKPVSVVDLTALIIAGRTVRFANHQFPDPSEPAGEKYEGLAENLDNMSPGILPDFQA